MPIAEKYRPHYTYADYCQWEGNWELIAVNPDFYSFHLHTDCIAKVKFPEIWE